MKLKEYFPTLVVHKNAHGSLKMKRLTSDLLEESKIFKGLDEKGLKWSKKNYPHGYTSYSSMTDLPFQSNQFRELKKWIDKEVAQFSKALELDIGKTGTYGGKLEMTTMWINFMGKGCIHSSHLHPLSTISGTYYLKVPKASGNFKIEDPRLSQYMASPPRKTNAATKNKRFIEIAPKPGDLLLFESYIKHEVTENFNKEERVSVSFNYDWVRE